MPPHRLGSLRLRRYARDRLPCRLVPPARAPATSWPLVGRQWQPPRSTSHTPRPGTAGLPPLLDGLLMEVLPSTLQQRLVGSLLDERMLGGRDVPADR